MRVYLADPKGFHRFLAAHLEREGVVRTAVISAGNSIIVTGSQAASIQVGRKEGWAASQSEASLTNPAYRIRLWSSKGVILIPSNLPGSWTCSSEHISSTATLLKRRWPLTLLFIASSLSVLLLFLTLKGEHFINSAGQPQASVRLRSEILFHFRNVFNLNS